MKGVYIDLNVLLRGLPSTTNPIIKYSSINTAAGSRSGVPLVIFNVSFICVRRVSAIVYPL